MKEAKKMKCSKRLIRKQYFQVSTLCGSSFLCYLSHDFTELCMETPYCCSSGGHQYGGLKSTRTSGTQFVMKALSFRSCVS